MFPRVVQFNRGDVMNRLLTAVLCTPSLSLQNWPLESAPLRPEQSAALDDPLIGLWDPRKDDGGDGRVDILRFNENEYLFAMRPTCNENGAVERFRAYITGLAGRRVLNVRELKRNPTDRRYNSALYRFDQGVPRIRIVGDDLFPADDRSPETLPCCCKRIPAKGAGHPPSAEVGREKGEGKREREDGRSKVFSRLTSYVFLPLTSHVFPFPSSRLSPPIAHCLSPIACSLHAVLRIFLRPPAPCFMPLQGL